MPPDKERFPAPFDAFNLNYDGVNIENFTFYHFVYDVISSPFLRETSTSTRVLQKFFPTLQVLVSHFELIVMKRQLINLINRTVNRWQN